ncbi:cyanidin 3-O-rutinoside 5-O-glucosyltransferase-like [Dioscorea cayenensis subsp. rotundata]|uniref:Cyanidin 3-O-rutinoside 5-O-glucosyltransferase-like n=1 Tax=Dioscorea cayennensis subsp. rotundata TaxID=55577 RepID=A0AB40CTT6_DIOCR|nr:cyanidin 3-O-rutinoside 5-O-glucosyltransferase-like [Dioscorea cayenensis subsp. rotundata]
MADKQHHHFLFITSSHQGHISPTLHLARHLATSTGAAVTFSTTVFAHRRMFSSNQDLISDGLITFIPYSDGYDDGFKSEPSIFTDKFHSYVRTNSKRSVSEIVGNHAGRGQPVTCIIYTIVLNWAVEVAREHGILSVLYWIQTSSVFATYYHFFHGFESLIKTHIDDLSFTVSFPGLQPLQIRDLPSFVRVTNYDSADGSILCLFREMFEILDEEKERMKAMVLMNTFQEWETDALASFNVEIEAIPVGLLPKETNSGAGYLFKEDEKKYMEWLDTKEDGSVVYISFGTMVEMKKEQIKEMVKGLKESKRPYLWVVRKDNREEELLEIEGGGDGMVVEWCSQVRVLAHKAVGCIVTHCGWNSTLESLACGVPMVCVPQWSDQGINAKLVESLWGCGVRSEVDGDGVVKGEELVRCLELVMGDGEKGVEIRRKAKMWKDEALVAGSEGGSSYLNFRAFVRKISD